MQKCYHGLVTSTIEWTDETWNPVTGCSRVSPGCDNCYMFALYPRLRAMAVPGYDTAPDSVQILPERLKAPLSWRRPRQVFVNSMSDLFHPHVEYDFISDVFDVMREADQHVFQVLTKRPGRAAGWWESTAGAYSRSGRPTSGWALRWRARSTRLGCPCCDGSPQPYASCRQSRCWKEST